MSNNQYPAPYGITLSNRGNSLEGYPEGSPSTSRISNVYVEYEDGFIESMWAWSDFKYLERNLSRGESIFIYCQYEETVFDYVTESWKTVTILSDKIKLTYGSEEDVVVAPYDIEVSSDGLTISGKCGDNVRVYIYKKSEYSDDYIEFRHLNNQSGTFSLNLYGPLEDGAELRFYAENPTTYEKSEFAYFTYVKDSGGNGDNGNGDNGDNGNGGNGDNGGGVEFELETPTVEIRDSGQRIDIRYTQGLNNLYAVVYNKGQHISDIPLPNSGYEAYYLDYELNNGLLKFGDEIKIYLEQGSKVSDFFYLKYTYEGGKPEKPYNVEISEEGILTGSTYYGGNDGASTYLYVKGELVDVGIIEPNGDFSFDVSDYINDGVSKDDIKVSVGIDGYESVDVGSVDGEVNIDPPIVYMASSGYYAEVYVSYDHYSNYNLKIETYIDGILIPDVEVYTYGYIYIDFPTKLTNGEEVKIRFVDVDGNGKSDFVYTYAPVKPDAPYNVTISSDGKTITGQGDEDYQYAYIYYGGGNSIAYGVVMDGVFEITLNNAFVDGEKLEVVFIQDGLRSDSVYINAPIVPPEIAKNVTFSSDGLTLSGEGQESLNVILYLDNEPVSDAIIKDGVFVFSFNEPFESATELEVKIWRNGVSSDSLFITAPDITSGGDEYEDDFVTGVRVFQGGERPDFTKYKIVEIGNTIFNIEKSGYELTQDPVLQPIDCVMNVSEYNMNYRDNIIYSLNNVKLGGVTSDTDLIIDIYNAFDYDLLITSIDEVGIYGLEYTLSSDDLLFFHSTRLSLKVLKSGEIDNNGYLQFNFSDGTYSRFYISYSRQNLFDLITNETKTTQVFAHNTDVLQMVDNSEERVNLTEVPFYTIQVLFEVQGRDRVKLENLINSTKDDVFNMPIYNESFTGFTDDGLRINGDFRHTNIMVGDQIYIIDGSNKYTIKVDAIEGDELILSNEIVSRGYFTVYPLILTRFSKLNRSVRFNGNYAEYDLIFDVIQNGRDYSSNKYNYNFEIINGLPFYDFLLNNGDIPTERTSEKNLEILSNGISNDVYIYNNEKSLVTEDYELLLKDRFEICRIKRIFKDAKGMMGEFYTIKAEMNLIQSNSVGVGSNVLYIKNADIVSSYLAGEFEHIVIYTAYGERIIRKLENALIMDDNTEAVYFNETFDRGYEIGDILGVYPIVKTRFNDDELIINYETSTIATVKIRTVTVR